MKTMGEVVNDTALPVVCFTHPRIRSGAVPTRKLVQGLWRRGEAWVSDTRVGGRVPAVRACVTNVDSRAEDVDALVAAMAAAVIGGLITATLLTLFVLPAICRVMLRTGHRSKEGEMPTAYTDGAPVQAE